MGDCGLRVWPRRHRSKEAAGGSGARSGPRELVPPPHHTSRPALRSFACETPGDHLETAGACMPKRFICVCLRPPGLQAASLLCPWDSPGQNAGVGCHFLLGDLPDPGIKTMSLMFLHWQVGSLSLAGYPLQYSCLENSSDRGARQATIHGVTQSWTHFSN